MLNKMRHVDMPWFKANAGTCRAKDLRKMVSFVEQECAAVRKIRDQCLAAGGLDRMVSECERDLADAAAFIAEMQARLEEMVTSVR